MTMDPFRPRREPALTICEAFQAEAAHRGGREVSEWREQERRAVWNAARDYAQQRGLPVPTMAQIEDSETTAVGHIDYGAKWAHRVAALLVQSNEGRA